MANRPMGENQEYALKALAEHNGGTWYPGAGWVWTNVSTTVRLLDSLVRRGLVEKTTRTRRVGTRPESYPFYSITEAGRNEI
jgi:DNA-binding MarR family transcriptional regulator